jgi:hypothetical protein
MTTFVDFINSKPLPLQHEAFMTVIGATLSCHPLSHSRVFVYKQIRKKCKTFRHFTNKVLGIEKAT